MSPFHSIAYVHPPPTYLLRTSASFTDRPDWPIFCHMTISLIFTRFFIYFLFISDEGPTLETLDYTIRIGSTPTFLYFDLYLYSGYAACTLRLYTWDTNSSQVRQSFQALRGFQDSSRLPVHWFQYFNRLVWKTEINMQTA